jgi:hypothetical protein
MKTKNLPDIEASSKSLECLGFDSFASQIWMKGKKRLGRAVLLLVLGFQTLTGEGIPRLQKTIVAAAWNHRR